eukprot:m.35079 g.35079  ORF g.35079 m.35079 type:complete len:96 (-) comp9568_c0_seq4:22-309(-)
MRARKRRIERVVVEVFVCLSCLVLSLAVSIGCLPSSPIVDVFYSACLSSLVFLRAQAFSLVFVLVGFASLLCRTLSFACITAPFCLQHNLLSAEY